MKKIRKKCRVNLSCLVIVNFAYENTLYYEIKVLSLPERNKQNSNFEVILTALATLTFKTQVKQVLRKLSQKFGIRFY